MTFQMLINGRRQTANSGQCLRYVDFKFVETILKRILDRDLIIDIVAIFLLQKSK
jgi:hypothetical protein